jgi:uncharacterized protein (TIGR00369 family)
MGGRRVVGNTSRLIEASDGRRYAFADHNCFACGTHNPKGMRLVIELGPGKASTSWDPDKNDVGWNDRVHGGLLATMLDEVMAWAPASDDAWAVTAEMSVRFRSPAAPGERLVATARVTERRRRVYRVSGEVVGPDGRVIAEGHGRYLGATPSQKAALKEEYGTSAGTQRDISDIADGVTG